jgi:hypothetical protein
MLEEDGFEAIAGSSSRQAGIQETSFQPRPAHQLAVNGFSQWPAVSP